MFDEMLSLVLMNIGNSWIYVEEKRIKKLELHLILLGKKMTQLH